MVNSEECATCPSKIADFRKEIGLHPKFCGLLIYGSTMHCKESVLRRYLKIENKVVSHFVSIRHFTPCGLGTGVPNLKNDTREDVKGRTG